MRTLLNILWFILGGLFMGLAWWLIGLIAYLTIIGIPWGKACFIIGKFSFFPFGKEAISRKDLNRGKDIGTGAAGTVGNAVWFVLAGIWLAIGHIIAAAASFLIIVAIPFGFQHLKLAKLTLAPIGKTIVSTDEATVARAARITAKASG